MQKKSLLALVLASSLVLSSCALVKKDVDVDNARTVITVGDKTFSKKTVKDNVDYQLNYTAYIYQLYGMSFDATDSTNIANAQQQVVDSMIKEEVITQKAAPYRAALTEEEKTAAKETADTEWANVRETVKTNYLTDSELEGDALEAAIDEYLAKSGVTYDSYVESAENEAAEAKLRADTVADVTATDEDLQSYLDTKAESDKTTFTDSVVAFGNRVNNGLTAYYRPAGYRMTKQILVKFDEADQAVLDSLQAKLDDASSRVETLTAQLTEAGVENVEDLTAKVEVPVATATPVPTAVPVPTDTPVPEPTVEATATPAIEIPTATPVIEVPTATPVIEVPTATPVIEAPTATPAIEIPTATPVIEIPTATPAIVIPTATPVIEAPTATPETELDEDEEEPTATPEFKMPTATPAIEIPTATPEFKMPTATPAIEIPTATPEFVMPTATPVFEVPTATPAIEIPTATPVIEIPTATPVATETPVPDPTATPEPTAEPTATPRIYVLEDANVGDVTAELGEEVSAENADVVKQLAAAKAEVAFYTEQLAIAKEQAYANIAPIADDIIAQLEAGADWDTLMAEKTQDPGMQEGAATAKTGYAVCEGFTSFDANYVNAAMAIEQVGQWSPKTAGSYGYYIIQYTAEVTEGPATLDEVRGEIYDTVLSNNQDAAYDSATAEWVKESGAKYDLKILND